AVVAVLHRFLTRREPRFLVATGLAGLTVVILLPMFSDRPWLLTILLATLTLEAILDLRQGQPTRAIWWLPPLFVLWANVHIQFIYGLFLLVLACAAPVVDWLLERRETSAHASRIRTRSWWQ